MADLLIPSVDLWVPPNLHIRPEEDEIAYSVEEVDPRWRGFWDYGPGATPLDRLCYLPDASIKTGLRDIFGRHDATIVQGVAADVGPFPCKWGNIGGGINNNWTMSSEIPLRTEPDWTLLHMVRLDGVGGSSSATIAWSASFGDSNPYYIVNTAGSRYRVYQFGTYTPDMPGWNTGQYYFCASTRVGVNWTHWTYNLEDGIAKEGPTDQGLDALTNRQLYVGDGVFPCIDGPYALVAKLGRALDESEIFDWFRDPYGFVRKQNLVIHLQPFTEAGGSLEGSGSPVTVNAGAGTLAGTGTAPLSGSGSPVTVAAGSGTLNAGGALAGAGALVTVSAGSGALTGTGAAALTGSGSLVTVVGGSGGLTGTGAAPMAGAGALVTVDAGSGALAAGGASLAGSGALVTVDAGAGALAGTGVASITGSGALVTVSAGSGALSGGLVAFVDAVVVAVGYFEPHVATGTFEPHIATGRI